MESVSLYSEARNEYLKQLSTWIVPPLVEFFRKEYNRISEQNPGQAMMNFQKFCDEVPRWNQDVIDTHVGTLLDTCRCDYVEELMTAVFIAHTKMLTAIRVNSKQKKLQITLPKLDRFLHRVFVECARAFWKAPFLFATDLTPIEKQKNVLQAEAMCTEALSGGVRSLLPVKSILADYLNDDESEEEEAPVPAKKGGKAPAVVESDSSDSESEEEEEEKPAAPAIVTSVVAPAAPVVATPAVVTPVTETVVAPVVAPVVMTAVTALPEKEKKEEKPQFVVGKLDSSPDPVLPTSSSNHSAPMVVKETPVNIIKEDTQPVVVEGLQAQSVENDAPKLTIDTEPTVHFTPYDTVYDETTAGISEIRYTPKVSVEDKPPSTWGLEEEDEDVPKLSISNASSEIGLDDIESIGIETVEEDAPLSMGGDFEVIS